MPRLTITVSLIANEVYANQPDATQLPSPGVVLQLAEPRKKTQYLLDATSDAGVTGSAEVAEGKYEVTVPNPEFDAWTIAPKEIQIKEETEDKTVLLIPRDQKWALPLLLCGYDGQGAPIKVPGAPVKDSKAGTTFQSLANGYVYAAVPPGTATLSFKNVSVPGAGLLQPQDSKIKFEVIETPDVEVTQVQYLADTEASASPLARMSIEPKILTASGYKPLTGASARIEYSTRSSARVVSLAKELEQGKKKIWFNDLLPGIYSAAVTPPAKFNNWPVAQAKHSFTAESVRPGRIVEHQTTSFRFEKVTVIGRVQAVDGRLVEQDVHLEIYGSENSKILTVKGGTFEVQLDWGVRLEIRLARNDEISVDDIPLQPEGIAQPLSLSSPNVLVLPFKYGIKGQAVDEAGDPVPGAIINVFNDQQESTGSVAADADGNFIAGTPTSGSYFVAPQMSDGGPVTRQLVPVQSIGDAGKVVIPSSRSTRAEMREKTPDDGDGGRDGRSRTREAITDLASYPVLTEEVSTIGPPAPAGGAPGGAGPGAGYGQTVDRVMRDVLGWRPSGDVAGFQAALTGAFQLRDVEGHTEWMWQQRGYAVQADMGALTGAQASIYARAKAALDQIQPLLAGVTALNPNAYPPEDLETIRTVITAELQELVNELALEGGPRIQRVNELFKLLAGESHRSFDPNPDHVQGQLGTMRDRFGLTEEWVDTVDEERILTNFRIVVEQVLSLQESWFYDRKLLSVVDSKSSLGTILIWLSRGLEAVCESVDDLTFALDSVYVDAAQRQVIELRLPNQAPLLLSDLLDWVVRSARDEGPRLIQDAGRDGVDAFAPVLRELRSLIQGTRTYIGTSAGAVLPDGLRTPRVHRAFQVLEAQLTEATRLARLVEEQSFAQPPQITAARVGPGTSPGEIQVTMTGINFRKPASAFLLPANRGDIADVPARNTKVKSPSSAIATFRIPTHGSTGDGVKWQVVLASEDSQSNPADVKL